MAAFLEDTANGCSVLPSAATTPLACLVPLLAPVRGNGSWVAPRPASLAFPSLLHPPIFTLTGCYSLKKKTVETNLTGDCICPQLCPNYLPPSRRNSYGAARARRPHSSRQAASSPRPPRWSQLAGTGRDPIRGQLSVPSAQSQQTLLALAWPHHHSSRYPARSLRWGLSRLTIPGLGVS